MRHDALDELHSHLVRRTRAVLAVAALASHESVVSIDLAGKPQPGPRDDSKGLSFGLASRQVDQAATFFRLIDAVLRSVHNSNPLALYRRPLL